MLAWTTCPNLIFHVCIIIIMHTACISCDFDDDYFQNNYAGKKLYYFSIIQFPTTISVLFSMNDMVIIFISIFIVHNRANPMCRLSVRLVYMYVFNSNVPIVCNNRCTNK